MTFVRMASIQLWGDGRSTSLYQEFSAKVGGDTVPGMDLLAKHVEGQMALKFQAVP